MKREITPEQIRRATLAHLETAAASGLRHVTRKKKASEPPVATAKSAPASSRGPDPAAAPCAKPPKEPLGPTIVPDKIRDFETLRAFIGDCPRCKLCTGRKTIVFGVGNVKADLMFVGEGPGADEDEQGEPFVGRAGQLLTKMIEAMGFQRSDVYIGNIVKCRPPENRNPEPDEIAACKPFLLRQIDIVKPKIIVCLGRIAAQALLETQIPISKIRGRFQDWNGMQVMPTYHPAFLLRNPPMKKYVWEDLQQVMKLLGKKVPAQTKS